MSQITPPAARGLRAPRPVALERLLFEVHELVDEDRRTLQELRRRVESGRSALRRPR